jgi:V/A-type H+-transporting ATPase subunit D
VALGNCERALQRILGGGERVSSIEAWDFGFVSSFDIRGSDLRLFAGGRLGCSGHACSCPGLDILAFRLGGEQAVILDVNATRMELLRLRKRLALARRGHKLLKDKQDELMRQFLLMVHEARRTRLTLEEHLAKAYQRFLFARAVLPTETLETALLATSASVRLSVELRPVMNLRVPSFEAEIGGDVHSYGLLFTSGELDVALEGYAAMVPEMVRLAEQEKTLEMLAQEIEVTRRRVNALEYILIPNLGDTIRHISLKLSEMERGDLVRLMKVKAMLEEARQTAV